MLQPSLLHKVHASTCCVPAAPSARPPPVLAPLPGEERWLHPLVRGKGRAASGEGSPAPALLAEALDAPLLPAQQQQVLSRMH